MNSDNRNKHQNKKHKPHKRERTKSSPENKQKETGKLAKRQCQTTIDDFVVQGKQRADELDNFEEFSGDSFNISVMAESVNTAQTEAEHSLNSTIVSTTASPTLSPPITPQQLPQESRESRQDSQQLYMSQDTSQGMSQVLDKHGGLLQRILESQERMQQNFMTFETHLESINRRLNDQASNIEQLSRRVNIIEQKEPTSRLKRLEEQLNVMDRKQREKNVRLVGIREDTGDTCLDIVMNIVQRELNVAADIKEAYRAGRQGNQPRHIIFRCSSLDEKIAIFRAQRHALRNKSYFFVDDLTKKDYEAKLALKPQIDAAKQQGKRWRFKNGVLYVNGERFLHSEEHYQDYGMEQPMDQMEQMEPVGHPQLCSPVQPPQPPQGQIPPVPPVQISPVQSSIGQPPPGQPPPGQPPPGQPPPGQPLPGQLPVQRFPGGPPSGQPLPGHPLPGQYFPRQPPSGQPGQPVQAYSHSQQLTQIQSQQPGQLQGQQVGQTQGQHLQGQLQGQGHPRGQLPQGQPIVSQPSRQYSTVVQNNAAQTMQAPPRQSPSPQQQTQRARVPNRGPQVPR
jgi:hypothetical protein